MKILKLALHPDFSSLCCIVNILFKHIYYVIMCLVLVVLGMSKTNNKNNFVTIAGANEIKMYAFINHFYYTKFY